jgi:hypothetical protein
MNNVASVKTTLKPKRSTLLVYSLEFRMSCSIVPFLYSNTESQVEKFQRVEDNFAALQAALREIQADNSDKV